MNKKKLALTACATALVGTLAIGGTLAYLTSKTNTVENVFTGEDKELGGKITECFDKDKAEKYMPGDAIYKIPKLVNDESSVEAWVAVKVDFTKEGETISYDEFKKYASIQTKDADKNFQDGFNTADFEELPGLSDNYKVFVYKEKVAPGQSTKQIFDQVTMDAKIKSVYNKETKVTTAYREVTAEDYEKAAGNKQQVGERYFVEESVTKETVQEGKTYFLITKDANGETVVKATDVTKLPQIKVNVSGYMVQAQNVDYNTAKEELKNLVLGNDLK